jgi:HEAT repeat protein
VLKYIVLDPQVDRKVHVQAMTRLGEIGTPKAADAVLEILPQVQDGDVRIEGLIAIGTMRDMRATYLIEQLANDPNEAVAFTATEVLQKLERSASQKPASEKAASSLPQKIPERKIDRVAGDQKPDTQAKTTGKVSANKREIQKAEDTAKGDKAENNKPVQDSMPVKKEAASQKGKVVEKNDTKK